ncbi:MAG: hypothetical protein ABIF85_05640 [Nanoarchaeota archaeon]|nr:hypothetical protein [Nanoarchaeota archaeon]MBU4301101.1 hypothetical protein [Nanoarchaeota archaeon]MBU4451917.1 hypothetical protein [Nanoarchaeota archaeon]MCG2724598.1 hypothetical protein [archaeon]
MVSNDLKEQSNQKSDEKLDRIVKALERIADALESVEEIPGDDISLEEDKQSEIPEEIKSATPEKLASELIAFIQKEFSDEANMSMYRASEFFWSQKNIRKYEMPPEVRLKIEKVEMLAEKQLNAAREVKDKAQLEKEKLELPSTVTSCVNWAREHNLKKITLADVDAYLLDKNIELLYQIKRSLYAMANVAIKSKN